MILPHVLDYIGYRSLELSHRVQGHQVHPQESWARYYKDDPFELQRITYPLDKDSIVVDLGGYKGDWSQQIYCRYRCNIDIYEPHPVLAALVLKRFGGNPSIRVFPFGLSNRSAATTLYGDDIYASVYESSGAMTEVFIKKASDVFNRNYPDGVDLLKINIEGSEYDVLPDMIENYEMSKIDDIQIQFHNTIPGYQSKRKQIQELLKETHVQEWCYDYLYESWRAK